MIMRLKANLHTHTQKSDGALPPEEMVREYKKAGFNAVALTDHAPEPPESEFVYDYDVDVKGITVLNGAELSRGHHTTCIRAGDTIYKQCNHPMRYFGKGDMDKLNRWAQRAGAHHVEVTEHASSYCDWPSQCDIITRTNLDPITSDDSHGASGVGRTEVIVNAKSEAPEDILKALIKGRYAIGGYW